jgi:hypothetical protein
MADYRGNPSPGVSPSRWQRLSLDEQLANLGTDVSRAARAKEAGDSMRLATWLAMARAEFDLTLSDPRWESERPEIERMRLVVEDLLDGPNTSGSSSAALDEFFVPFALRANEARRLQREQPDRPSRPAAVRHHDREE